MSGCSDILLLLLNVHFLLKNKKLLSQIIYMEMTLLLAEKQENELFTLSFKTEQKEYLKKKPIPICIHLWCSLKIALYPDLTTAMLRNGS